MQKMHSIHRATWFTNTHTHNFTNYLKLTHIFLFVLSFVLRVDCRTFFIHGPNAFCMFAYKYKCQCCGALYVGQTRRHTHTRISRESRPKLHGNKLSVSQMSAVLTHHHLSKHTISDSDFTIILTSGSFKFDLEMRESLLISNWNLYLTIISPLCLCIDSNVTWYVDISVITNYFVLILTYILFL